MVIASSSAFKKNSEDVITKHRLQALLIGINRWPKVGVCGKTAFWILDSLKMTNLDP